MKENIAGNQKASIDEKMPSEFKHLISQADYEAILRLIVEYFEKSGKTLRKIKDGQMRVVEKIGGRDTACKYSLYNLIRRLCDIQKDEWRNEIHQFLGSNVNLSAYNFFFDDYESAKKHLKILVKPESFVHQDPNDKFISTSFFPRYPVNSGFAFQSPVCVFKP